MTLQWLQAKGRVFVVTADGRRGRRENWHCSVALVPCGGRPRAGGFHGRMRALTVSNTVPVLGRVQKCEANIALLPGCKAWIGPGSECAGSPPLIGPAAPSLPRLMRVARYHGHYSNRPRPGPEASGVRCGRREQEASVRDASVLPGNNVAILLPY